jgi:hypothetical protein
MSVIETHTFRLAEGADLAEFLDADRQVQTELMLRKPTFLRRTTARSGEGDWLVVVIWSSARDADIARTQLKDDQATTALMTFVDQPTFTTRRYETLD